MNPSHKQLTAFLETTEAKLDLTDFSKCIAYLYDSEMEEVASNDVINSRIVCQDFIWIGEEKYTLTENQKDFILNYFYKEVKEDLNTWQEMKNDTYNVRDDQY